MHTKYLREMLGIQVPENTGQLYRVHAPDVWVVGFGVVLKPQVDKLQKAAKRKRWFVIPLRIYVLTYWWVSYFADWFVNT